MVVLIFPSYWLEDSCIDPRPNAAEGICEGNTGTTNFNLFINCPCEISQSENGNCTVIKYICILC